jgi:hypothetical protein
VCRRLYSTAAAAGIEVPYEANLTNVGSLVWLEQLMVSVVGVFRATVESWGVLRATGVWRRGVLGCALSNRCVC